MGTRIPVTCRWDWPNWSLAMSRIAGCSIQPESLTTVLMSTGAPHSGQVGCDGSLGCRQYRQMYWFMVYPSAGLLARVVVDVRGLDADPAGAGHLGHVDV